MARAPRRSYRPSRHRAPATGTHGGRPRKPGGSSTTGGPRWGLRQSSECKRKSWSVKGMGRTNDTPIEPPLPCARRSEEHTSELQSRGHLVCRLLLEKKKPALYRVFDSKQKKTRK